MNVSVRKKTSNKKVIAKMPLTNLYEMNSKYFEDRISAQIHIHVHVLFLLRNINL